MDNRKINILQLVNGFGVGGGEKKLLELVRCLDRDKYNLVVCSVGQGGPLEGDFRELGVDVYVFTKRNKLDITLPLKVADLIKRYQIDILQTTLFYADIIGAIATVLAKVKALISWEVITQPLKLRHRLAYKLLKDKFDLIVSVSDSIRSFIEKERAQDPGKIVTVHYGVDMSEFHGEEKVREALRRELGFDGSHSILGVVARLTDQKGHIYLIKAAPKVVNLFPNVRFVLVGDGPNRAMLMAKVQELGLADHFTFLGTREDVSELLNAFDVFVLPSLWEGLPNVVLEAMACGKPVIATSVDGTTEAVIDGETGILVPPRDPESLARAIINLLSSRELLKEYGEKGYQRAKDHFSLENQVKGFEDLYDSQSMR